jgi:chromosome segregation ATPase
MKKSKTDSAFEPTYPRSDDYPSGNGNSAGHVSRKNPKAGSPRSEMDAIAEEINELEGRLERARRRLDQSSTSQATELEIGRLLFEAQRFAEASVAKLEREIQEILVEAEAKAAEIIREATQEAQEIRYHAQQSSFIPSRTAEELQSAIIGFADMNGDLVRELHALYDLLRPLVDRRTDSFNSTSAAMGPN